MSIKDERQEWPTKLKTLQLCETCPSIPNEIITEILLKLPVRSLLRFKSVCKLWHSLISDPYFIKTHLSLATSNPHYIHHRLISQCDFSSCRLYDVMFDKPITNVTIYPENNHCYSVMILGSCNGLLCLSISESLYRSNLFIWNPVTRRSSKVPDYCLKTVHDRYLMFGFGYDESTDDYKVVVITGDILIKIYSLKFGNWKDCYYFQTAIITRLHGGTYLNGTLHWAGKKDSEYSESWRIVSFNLEKETYGEVLPPEYDEGRQVDLTLGVLGEWLCMVCNYLNDRADVWVMKVYGVNDSWTKLVSIPYLTDLGLYQYSVPLCILSDGRVLLKFRGRLYKYDSKVNSLLEIENFVTYHTVYTFVESLVSPDVRMALVQQR